MKDEKITVSPLSDPTKLMPYSRKKFYDEQYGIAGNQADLGVHVISILLFDPNGDLILQKRSLSKLHNPGLMDKTLGGHITFGDSPDYTAMVESVQELLTPSIVLDNDTDFNKAFDLLQSYTDTIGIIKKDTVRPWRLQRLHDGKNKQITNIVHLYFGIYGGRMRPADREAAGVLYYSFDQLLDEIKLRPDSFTDDVAQICKEYRPEILAFRKKVQQIES